MAALAARGRCMRTVGLGSVSVTLTSGVEAARALHAATSPVDDPLKCIDLREFAKSLDRAVRVRVYGLLLVGIGVGMICAPRWGRRGHSRSHGSRWQPVARHAPRLGRRGRGDVFELLNRDLRDVGWFVDDGLVNGNA